MELIRHTHNGVVSFVRSTLLMPALELKTTDFPAFTPAPVVALKCEEWEDIETVEEEEEEDDDTDDVSEDEDDEDSDDDEEEISFAGLRQTRVATFVPRVRPASHQTFVVRSQDGAELSVHTTVMDANEQARSLKCKCTVYRQDDQGETAMSHNGPGGWNGTGRKNPRAVTP